MLPESPRLHTDGSMAVWQYIGISKNLEEDTLKCLKNGIVQFIVYKHFPQLKLYWPLLFHNAKEYYLEQTARAPGKSVITY